MDKLLIILFVFFSIGFIYFLCMVSIQFTRISKINLQLGMDVTKLYDNEDEDIEEYFNYIIRHFAMFLYKLSNRIK